ncbi:phage major capsid protein [Phyllobacterium chamaecytisi]|uniref:phage major capsid protein n=1 Tax=Phyllobacterium chamaecytisi TaxID=2876082 RepID=UPI001CCA8A74|nr:phage major capsid protein [Phyllobacterium sp. KW56]MBZ9604267.1 phage major capsid protein [Phyllobacterium sp. KW56]
MNAISTLPRGLMFTRYVKALALNKGSLEGAAAYSAETYGPMSPIARITKAASDAGSTLPSSDWGSQLADYSSTVASFLAIVSERSIPGRIGGLVRVPLLTRLITQIGPAVAAWVGQTLPKPVSEMAFAADELPPLKIAALSVVSNELLRSANPVAETWLRDALVNALVLELNKAFIDPANAGTEDVKPASVLHNAPTIPATGVWKDDLGALLGLFEGNAESASIILNGKTAAGMTGADQPGLDVRGGTLSGFAVVTDPSVPLGVVGLIDAAQVSYGEDALRVDASQQGTLVMDSAPAPTAPATVSLWQRNLVAIRCEQGANWSVGKVGATAYLTGVGG